ncbi:MAG: hypothetical protein AAF915_03465 [Cyanobacteria bacterium P01_D01_bin.50]
MSVRAPYEENMPVAAIPKIVRCPNCGNLAQREFLNKLLSDYINYSDKTVVKTECKSCDYLMIIGCDDGHP